MIKTTFLALRTYRFLLPVSAVLSLGWCAFLAAGVTDLKAIGPYAISSVGILSGASALFLRQRLSSPWTGTVPGYRDSHIAAALIFCVYAVGVASAITALLGIPLTLALYLWSFSVIPFVVAFFPLHVWRLVTAICLVGILVGASPVLIPKLVLDLNIYVATTLVIANTALTTLAIWRIRRDSSFVLPMAQSGARLEMKWNELPAYGSIVACIGVGAALIGLSHRRWCDMEVD